MSRSALFSPVMAWSPRLAVLLLGTVLFTGCPGERPADRPAESVLTVENAWNAPVPADATHLEPEGFKQAVASGELMLDNAATRKRQHDAAQKTYAADLAYLQSLQGPSPVVARLLGQIARADPATLDRDITHRRADGQSVRLLGLADQVRLAADAQRRVRDPANALDSYRMGYDLLPDDRRSGLPAPDALQGKHLDEIQSALQQLNQRMSEGVQEQARPEPLPPRLRNLSQPAPGTGTDASDNGGVCTPRNLVRRFWFPLKQFLPPVKNQGNRSTCWAFTAIGALESRERVQRDSPIDLSEQFLVHRYKLTWYPSNYDEGGSADAALNAATSRLQGLPQETQWRYNLSNSRSDNKTAQTYTNSCANYTGTCGNNAPQGERVCTRALGMTFCGIRRIAATGVLTMPAMTNELWASGQPFLLSLYRNILASGHVLLVYFPLYPGIDGPPADGVVTDYATTPNRGGHVVQLVGFISNEQLAAVHLSYRGGGGGFFILKNSWACGYGDGGYAYIPADYVEKNFGGISALIFNNVRGNRWQQEQANPGTIEAPEIEVLDASARADLRVPFDIEHVFRVTHSTASAIRLTLTSDRQGVVYDGPLVTRQGGIRDTLKVLFQVAGAHALTASVQHGANTALAQANVQVVNTAPTARLDTVGSVYARQTQAFDLVASDPNESDPAALCASAQWQVPGGVARIEGTGCTRRITFDATGQRVVQVQVRDREGLTGSSTRSFRVLPAPANPYPRIVSGTMRERKFIQGRFRYCGDSAIAEGATIDLGQKGCRVLGLGDGALPLRHFASVSIENPSGEPLTYDWTLYVTRTDGSEHSLDSVARSASTGFTPSSGGNNSSRVTLPCRVLVKVNAPDPARSKTLRVWTGRCTYWASYLG